MILQLRLYIFCLILTLSLGTSVSCASEPIVWFVHGMYTIRDNFDPELAVLKKIFPVSESVELIEWPAPKDSIMNLGKSWSESLIQADEFAPELADKIESLSDSQRDRLILVGHSLGCRIIVKASVELERRHISVRQIVLAGAAVDNDDPDITHVLAASKDTVYNIINFNDIMLGVYKTAGEFNSALGTGYLYAQPKDRFREIVLSGTVEHYGYRYFEKWLDCKQKNNFDYDGVIVPQDFVHVDAPTMGGYFWWTELDEKDGWRLQQNKNTGHCRILNPSGVRKAWGRKLVLQAAFEKVKQQL